MGTTPKLKAIDIDKYSDMNRLDTMYTQSSKSNSIIWCFAWIITLTLCAIGLYSWISLIPHCSFRHEHNVYRWETDESLDLNVIQTIGEQQPVFATVFTLLMNITIWIRHKYWKPFALTLLSAVCMGLLATLWETGFFYVGNFFEFTLFLSYYILDVFMYWLDDRKKTGDQDTAYYTL